MATQIMFGQGSVKSQVPALGAQHRVPVQQIPVEQIIDQDDNPYEGQDNLNEIDFGRTFAARYAEDTSMIMVFVLWLFFGGMGMHRFYMGHKWVGASIAGLGTFNGILFFTAGLHTIMSYFSGQGVATSGLLSAIIVMGVHFTWVLFDLPYIFVRKLTSR